MNKRFAKEHKLALLAARWELPSDDIVELIKKGIRWEEVTKYAGRTGILPIVAYNLSSNKKSWMPEDVKQHLKWILYMTTARNLQMYKVLSLVISALQKDSLDVILLKGPYLAATVYPNMGARAFSDLDLLVKKIDLPKVEKCFHAMNFFIPSPRELDKKEDFHLPFTEGKGSIVEIHWDFEREIRFSDKSLIREFWANAEKKRFELFEVKALSLEDALLLLCLHYAHHLLGMLGILSDIDKFVSFYKEKLNWEKFLLTAKKHALSRVAYLSLYYAAELFDTDIPKEVQRRLSPKWYVKKILHSELCRALVLSETESEIIGRTRSVIRAALMESQKTRFKYVFRYTFPPLEEVKLIYKVKSFRDVCIYYAILPFLCLRKAVKVCLWIRELIKRRSS
jgi:hypothetical protein